MALIKCKVCGHDISDKARKCPKCGCPTGKVKATQEAIVAEKPKNNSTSKILIAIVLLALFALLVYGVFFYFNKVGDANKETVDVKTVEAENPDDVVEFNRSKAKLLRVTKAEYANSLAPQAGNSYEAKNLCDGNIATAWAVNLDSGVIRDHSEGFSGPIFYVKCKRLSHIIIRNGYCKNNKSFKNNTRAAWVRFDADVDGESLLFEGTLKDTQEPQRLEIPQNLKVNNNINRIVMSFDYSSFYWGAKWNDLCISEVEFWGYE